ncbi:MAG TPA: SDR family oxidoreductase [Planctomycetota bacterium]|nr:SDR family oxidoreductase [Planctomycetota bacterium]
MRILVTGHLGYIGPHLVDLLLKDGHSVTGVDLDLFKESSIYPHALPQENRVMDIFDLRPQDLKGHDAVMHLAAISNDAMGVLNPELTWKVNFEGTLHVAECAKRAGVPRFLFSSSCSVYGKSDEKPIDERGRTAPVSVYAETKVKVEEALGLLADDSFTPVYLRNATAYGSSPRLRVDLVLNHLLSSAYTTGVIKVLTDGTPWRPLIHCRDIARAFVRFLGAPRDVIHDEAFNVGSMVETYQVRDVANLVKKILPSCELSFAEGATSDPRDYKVDFTKLNQAFPDFTLEYTLEKGARELHEHFLKHKMPMDCLTGDRFIRLKALKRKLHAGEAPRYFHLAEKPFESAATAS